MDSSNHPKDNTEPSGIDKIIISATNKTLSNQNSVSETASEKPSEKEISELTNNFGILTIEEQERIDAQKSKSEKPPKRERFSTGRTFQIKTRLNESELKHFRERLQLSGMKQGEFVRACLLNEKITVRNLTNIDEQLFEKIIEISSDLGRIGGLIRGTVIANKENIEVLTPDEKNELEIQIRELRKLKQELLVVVQNLYGNP